jgi:hypothetical protein
VNNDCDAETDEDDALDVATWYADTDTDGYGDPNSSDVDCDQPSGFVADNTDCDDTVSTTYPGATEVCDGVNNDCNSSTSEDNTARFVDSSGTTTDYASIGSSSAASTTAPTSAGTLTLCDGTFYMNWELVDDLDLVSLNGNASDVEIDGAASGAIFVLGDYPTYGSGYSVDLTLTDLTLTNGQPADSYELAGAVSCVDESVLSSVALDNVIVSANVGAGGGAGGVFTYGCDLAITDSELSGNESPHGAVFFQDAGDLSITDTVFDANLSTQGTSALVVAGTSAYSQQLSGVDFYDNDSDYTNSDSGSIYLGGGIAVDFDDVAVYNNGTASTHSLASSGVVVDSSTELTWTGSSSQSSGVWSNADAGSGVYLKSSGSSLISDVVDFGGASSNNADYDIDFSSSSGSAYYAPDDASFVCNNYRCGDDADGDGDASNDEEECTVGSTSSSTHYDYFEDVFWGAVYLADSTATLESFDAYMSTTSGCTVDWYLLSSTSTVSGSYPTMTWDVEWSNTDRPVSTGSSAWHSSGHIGIPVESGTYYSLAYASSCSSSSQNVGPHFQSSATNQDGGFGESVGHVYDTNLWGNMTVGGSFSRGTYFLSTDFLVRPHVTDLDAPSAGVCP